MFWIARLFQPFIYPDTWGFLLFLVAVFLYHRKNQKRAFQLGLIAFLLIVVPAIPIVTWQLLRTVERAYPTLPIHEYRSADAILVLGGTVARVAPPRYEPEEIGGSRLLPAVRLFKMGKAKRIVVAGGDPYPGLDGETRNQAVDMKQVLVDMGIPEEAIVVQGASRNTEEDILFSAKILNDLKLTHVLLVTNAFHMKRAMTLGQKTGIEWYPVPTGHEAPNVPLGIESFIPRLGFIRDTNRALKEMVGLQFARWRVARRS